MNSETKMSAEAMRAEAANDERLYLSFIVAGEEYGVDILRVQEIRGWSSVTLLPNSPDYLKGVLNLRGAIIPVIDMRLRFGLPATAYGPMTVVVVLRVNTNGRERIMGVVVDAVAETYSVSDSDIAPPPQIKGAIDTEFLQGLLTVEEHMIVILNVDELMNSGELAAERAADV